MVDRRSFILGGFALPFVSGTAWGRSGVAADGLVNLPQGAIRGQVREGIAAVKAIPYAAPPTGANRFRPPQPVAHWSGVRDGTAYAPAPIQADPGFGASVAEYLGTPTRSEDCLYLNVFAPDAPGPHPVYVWIHGGGNESGAASQLPPANGAFARDGIVQVTVGYRVGMLGFLELGALLGERYRGSGNNGLKDIVAALQWMRRNIHHFGGDPTRITLGGESAGAKNTLSVMAAPSAHGLFKQVIVQSGGETTHSLGAADRIAETVGGILRSEGRPANALLSLPAPDLLALQTKLRAAYDRPFPFRAVIDGGFLPRSPLAMVKAGVADSVAMLIGTNRDESIVFLNRNLVGKPLSQGELSNQDLAKVAPVFGRYRSAYPELSDTALRVRFLTAAEYWLASTEIAKAHAARGRAPTYLYRFDRRAQSGPFAGFASHVAEMSYVWRGLEEPMAVAMGHGSTAENRALADGLHRRWAAFIRGSRPDVVGGVAWPRFDKSSRMMVFDKAAAGELKTVDRDELTLWNQVPE